MSFRFPWHFLSSLLPHFNETAPARGKKSFVGVVDGAGIEESPSLPISRVEINGSHSFLSSVMKPGTPRSDLPLFYPGTFCGKSQFSILPSYSRGIVASLLPSPVEGERGKNSQLLFLLPPLVCRKNSDDLQFNLGCGKGRGGGGIGNSSQFPIPQRDFFPLASKMNLERKTLGVTASV